MSPLTRGLRWSISHLGLDAWNPRPLVHHDQSGRRRVLLSALLKPFTLRPTLSRAPKLRVLVVNNASASASPSDKGISHSEP